MFSALLCLLLLYLTVKVGKYARAIAVPIPIAIQGNAACKKSTITLTSWYNVVIAQ